MKGLSFASGSCWSGGRLPGVITSTTPGWALAAATSSEATRPRATELTAITAKSMPAGWLSAA